MCIIHKNRWRCGYEDLRQDRTYERCSPWEKQRRYRHNQWFLCPASPGEVTKFHKMDRSCGHCGSCAEKQRRRNEGRESRMRGREVRGLAGGFVEWEGWGVGAGVGGGSGMGQGCAGWVEAGRSRAAEALVGFVGGCCGEGGRGGMGLGKGVELEGWVRGAYERAFGLLAGAGAVVGSVGGGEMAMTSAVGLGCQGNVALSATPSTPSPTTMVQGQVMPVREPQDRKRVRELWGQSTEEEGRGAGKRQCTTSPYQQEGW